MMTAKEFFQQVRRAEKELKMLNQKLAHYEDLGLSISSRIDGMMGSGQRGVSRVEMAAVGAVDALESIQKRQREYVAIIAQADAIIDAVPQEKYRQILNYRYLLGKSFSWISDELGYRDQNSVYRAHGWALYEAQKVINQKEEKDGKAASEKAQGSETKLD